MQLLNKPKQTKNLMYRLDQSCGTQLLPKLHFWNIFKILCKRRSSPSMMWSPSILSTRLLSSFTPYFSSSTSHGLTSHYALFFPTLTIRQLTVIPLCVCFSAFLYYILPHSLPQGMPVFSVASGTRPAWLWKKRQSRVR